MTTKKTSKTGHDRDSPSTPHPPAARKRLTLNSIKAARLEMSRVYRDARNGLVAPAAASKLTYILSQISDLLERENVGNLSEKLFELEGRLEEACRHK